MSHARGADPGLIARLRRVLGDGPPPGLTVLFGSAAMGRARAGSDLDIAIQASGALDAGSTRELIARLAREAGVDVDLVSIDEAPTLLKWRIAVDGVPLVEAAPGEFARFRARAASEYIEFAEAFAYHGEIFRRRLIEQGAPP